MGSFPSGMCIGYAKLLLTAMETVGAQHLQNKQPSLSIYKMSVN